MDKTPNKNRNSSQFYTKNSSFNKNSENINNSSFSERLMRKLNKTSTLFTLIARFFCRVILVLLIFDFIGYTFVNVIFGNITFAEDSVRVFSSSLYIFFLYYLSK